MTKRKAITPAMKLETLRAYACYVTCAMCGQSCALRDIQFDHHHATVFDGPHTSSNLRPLCVPCHLDKTKRDIRDNAHIKRLRGETKQGPRKKITPRGFNKTLKRRMDGRVEKRT